MSVKIFLVKTLSKGRTIQFGAMILPSGKNLQSVENN